ncbi:5-formyltetrahydrofolate cyclo-ligase [Dysgonomonas macrotermitis]|uniref:5-formyltetrahydrofolate cyclo-ligase n=1 Tax=Dysgonomonas macrotermitis TaxID=1346286 RepID=A0A1M5IL97_9BACT|nr:5-formyltetrahydrofolate cyclo-ligase [Dysgonomonas macrotermitis]SHG29134.1 5-formyltetrahydrofolate cyclo-ligase [Dysgonomonas macrotermitis]
MKKGIDPVKDKLRQEIASKKQEYQQKDLLRMSEEVFSVLEITGSFRDASTVFIYNSMPDEVATGAFIEKWIEEKDFYYPAVVNDNLVFRKVIKDTIYTKSKIGVFEPQGEDFTDYRKVDMVIVPGIAFDRKGNRLGRGKGYYDRFLSQIRAPKVGVCFDFQLLDQIPVAGHDVKMDVIVSENDLIW